ncbi:hypothetical protein [Amycolatopsis speibonae]|uniref:Helix-turn-helix domain-containing protein n=1 Tax=Amycolatopsis speibonae TaxID=1450224 RepID=A0ABV7P807_9PSEU
MSELTTYSVEDVVRMFGARSDSWLRNGIKTGRFSCLRVGRETRFTEEHVQAIAAALEYKATPSPAPAVDATVFGATPRSVARHRNRKAS